MDYPWAWLKGGEIVRIGQHRSTLALPAHLQGLGEQLLSTPPTPQMLVELPSRVRLVVGFGRGALPPMHTVDLVESTLRHLVSLSYPSGPVFALALLDGKDDLNRFRSRVRVLFSLTQQFSGEMISNSLATVTLQQICALRPHLAVSWLPTARESWAGDANWVLRLLASRKVLV